MKMQVCTFQRAKDAPKEYGVACVKEFELYDINWIIDEQGDKVKDVWTYYLISTYPGCMLSTVKMEAPVLEIDWDLMD